jgi:hypothetical protein
MKESADEVLARAIPVEKDLPEAPMSIHIDSYFKGFHVGTTIRLVDNTIVPVSRIMAVINGFMTNGFQPSWNVETNNAHSAPVPAPVAQPTTPQVTLGACPKCHKPLVEAYKKDGTAYTKCSTNKWNKITKTATGCDYVDWR